MIWRKYKYKFMQIVRQKIKKYIHLNKKRRIDVTRKRNDVYRKGYDIVDLKQNRNDV